MHQCFRNGHSGDERFFPFLGPLLIGGLAGYAIGRPWGFGGPMPYPVPYGPMARPNVIYVDQSPHQSPNMAHSNNMPSYGNIMNSGMPNQMQGMNANY